MDFDRNMYHAYEYGRLKNLFYINFFQVSPYQYANKLKSKILKFHSSASFILQYAFVITFF